MQNYLKSGETVSLTAPYAVASGACAKVGSIVGVACNTYASGASGEFLTLGEFDLASDTGTAWSAGDKIYWDDSAKVCTKTSTSNTLLGVATAAKTSGATTGRVRLNGSY